MSTDTAREPLRFAIWAAMALCSCALVCVVWSVPYIPTNDGPQIVLGSHILNHYSDPGSPFPSQVIPNASFSHLGFAFLFTPLEALLPWRDALRLVQSLGALGMAWAFFALVRAVEPRRQWVGLLGFAFAMTWSFYMGFFSYEIATAIGLAIVAYTLSRRELSIARCAAISIALLLQAAAHVFAADLTATVVAIVILARSEMHRRWREIGRAALIGAPVALVMAAALLQGGAHASIPMQSTFEWLGPGAVVRQVPKIILPGPYARAGLATAVVFGAVVLALLRWRRLGAIDRVIAPVAAALLACGLFSPMHVPGWQAVSPRFFPLAAALSISLLPVELLRSARVRTATSWLIALATAASLVVSFSLHRRLYAACSDYLSGLDQPIRRTGFQLPIALDPFCGMQGSEDRDVPLMAPSLHLGALYAVEQGGSVPQLFTGPRSGYLFSPRAAPPEKRGYTIPAAEKYWPILSSEAFRVDAEFRRHVLTDLAQHGRTYEAIVVFGATAPDVDTLERFGYVPEWRKGGLYIGAFRAE